MTNKSIVLREKVQCEDFKRPELKETLDKKTGTAIINAWISSTFWDKSGQIWIEKDKLHSILRTNKANSRYLLSKIPDENKVYIGSKEYIRGSEIGKIIDEKIQNSSYKTYEYLRYSEKTYISIRDSNKGKNIKREFMDRLEDGKKKLKRKRIKKYNIDFDELTGEKIKLKSCEFSHIRSVAMHPDMALYVENGLIVNKETHSIITKEGVNDEEELLVLCKNLDWKKDWYEKFLIFLEKNYVKSH